MSKILIKGISLFYLLMLAGIAVGQQSNVDNIKLNQIGFYPNSVKVAIIKNAVGNKFFIVNKSKRDTVFSSFLRSGNTWPFSNESVQKADFTQFHLPGLYEIYVPGAGVSYPFAIKDHVMFEAGVGALKGFYLIRASTDLPLKYAGKWNRKAGHPDTSIIIHPSAVSEYRKAGEKISSPGGWYDAGDYNKYIVNSGISTATLLSLYENYPLFIDTIKTNIPESTNKLPDLLDEVLYNLRWMLTMQDKDGGVYHKLTNPDFDRFVMPEKAKKPRYVVQKSTAATLDFSAVTAQASRVFNKFSSILPGLSDSCIKASKAAYGWALKNPAVYYEQSRINTKFNPDIITGEYPDTIVKDEFQWAAIELYISTGDKNYLSNANLGSILKLPFEIPTWSDVRSLGIYSLNTHSGSLKGSETDVNNIRKSIVKVADRLVANGKSSAYNVPFGESVKDFNWGSNSNVANQGILLLNAYSITHNISYLNAAIENLDYLFGRNAIGYSFLTGFGSKSTLHPHHRPSEADGIKEPVPGLLAGGPNIGMQDSAQCAGKYINRLPATAYIDDHCSYASNEIAINWNAPVVYLILGIEAIKNSENNK